MTNGNYKSDRAWSDGFIPAIKRIVGPHLLDIAPLEVDCKQAADLIIMRASDMTIACRVRRPGFAEQYGYEFTVRAGRDSGAVTELQKIVDGWGDWMFYAHAATEHRTEFSIWNLIDLHAWRAHLIRNRDSIIQKYKPNNDGTHFAAFDIRSFVGEPPLIIATSFVRIPYFASAGKQLELQR